VQIDFDRWKTEDEVDDEETRDIMGDYPDLYKSLEKEELGYRKGIPKLWHSQDNGVKGELSGHKI
jgi:hypothetical protein